MTPKRSSTEAESGRSIRNRRTANVGGNQQMNDSPWNTSPSRDAAAPTATMQMNDSTSTISPGSDAAAPTAATSPSNCGGFPDICPKETKGVAVEDDRKRIEADNVRKDEMYRAIRYI